MDAPKVAIPLLCLQEMEPAQVELAVRNAVLCARMKAHQKSQLVQLLGKGLQVDDARNLKVLRPRLL